MAKRILALAVCLSLCLALPVMAEEVPVRDNRSLFLSRLNSALGGYDPSSQALSLSLSVPNDVFSLRLLPTKNGARLEAGPDGTSAAALEAGSEALWILYEGQVLEIPFSLFSALAQDYASPAVGDMDAFIAKYREPLSAWAMKAWRLLYPMVSVSSSSSSVRIHISGDARQLTDAMVALVDDILADTRTVASLLEDLKPLLTAAGAGEIPDAAALKAQWEYARRSLLASGPDASLTMDVTLQPSASLFIASGTLTVNDEQLVFDARLRPGPAAGDYVLSASVSGSLPGNLRRAEMELSKTLSSGSSASRARTWIVDGALTVTSIEGDEAVILLDMTETLGGRDYLASCDGTLKISDIRHRTAETLDFGLTVADQGASLRLSRQDRWGDITDMRLSIDGTGLDFRRDIKNSAAALRIWPDPETGLPCGRFYVTDHDYGNYTEVIWDGEKLLYRDSAQEFLCRAEYPSPDHMVLLATRTEWSSSGEPATARMDVTLPGEGDPCILRGVITNVHGEEALRAELTAEPAVPVPSLSEREDRTVLDADMLMRLLFPSGSGEALPERE